MTTVILARHGETDWNRDGIWQGHGDPPLNDRGRAQAAALAGLVATERVDALYSSDLRRASETASFIASATGAQVILDPCLREMDVGSWTGLTIAEASKRLDRSEVPDGETREVFDARVVAALHRAAAAHPGARIVVVAHGGVARALQRHALGEALPLLGNGEHETYRYEAGRFERLGNDG
jgi:broad specificity phosphatase PhoE